ncbi:Peptidase family M23 [Catalinimonas alkaloidigena]|uniref:Peptidase family M23 n=1 Tax=Catalinimonas alkaloidigena TaxID=1075417 RepID=A0A1G9BYQ8_9BACT|nr:M23 family metallopeptidase [Catalinimonas alkaloidigena]SDK44568.1 Peptidase family M23 [Catalinimonas alkaloidigena]
MAKIKYYYDTHTCKYEQVRTSTSDILINGLAFLMLAAVTGGVIAFFYGKIFGSPTEAALRKENQELKFYYEVLDERMHQTEDMLTSLQSRDDNIYRTIFEAEPIPASVRSAGVGGAERYRELMEKGLSREDLIISTTARLDQLKKEMYIQTKSYDELVELIKNKNEMLAAIPAIRPLKDNMRVGSGFGKRVDPVYKTIKMHKGLDFAAPTGTKIYATGDGKIIKARRNGGYGECVIIDHGFGYQSLYGHMSKIVAKEGQHIKRGDVIGYIGSTGKSTGPHLHYEVIKNGTRINPINFFYSDLSPSEFQDMLEVSSNQNQSFD